MTSCKYTINLYTKEKINNNKSNTNSEYDYVHNNLENQKPSIIYLYKFNNGKKFYSVTNNNKFIIPPAISPILGIRDTILPIIPIVSNLKNE